MRRTSSTTNYLTTVRGRRRSLGILAACLCLWASLAAAAPPAPCDKALPLPLDTSIDGYVPAEQPVHYAVDVTATGFLLVEARTNWPAASPDVSLRDSACRSRSSNLPVAPIQGRHVHRVEPGTYFVEVAANNVSGASFRVDAWLIPDRGLRRDLLKDDPPEEPMGESDEAQNEAPECDNMEERFAAKDDPPEEPMGESDEMQSEDSECLIEEALRSTSWQEIAGHGLLELARTDKGHTVRVHPWCPWPERPGLLSTTTCARQIHLDESGEVTVRPVFVGSSELVGMTTAAAGWLSFDVPGGFAAAAAVFDARGQLVTELVAGEPVWLDAGGYFLRVETSADAEALRIVAELD